MKHTFLIAAVLLNTAAWCQNEFDKYGPFGSIIYTDLKEALAAEEKVYKLDLSNKVIDPKLYEKFSKLTDLQALKLHSNDLTEYPKNFESLFNLTYFGSTNNKFSAFPANLMVYRNLQFIELLGTAIDSIPSGIAYLNKLRSLNFGNTEDTVRIPQTLQYLRSLKDLSFQNCVLDSFPKPIFKISSLVYLNLNNTGTFALSKHFERLPNLEVLVIENNHLTKIPFEIYLAQKLRIVSFRGNKLTKVPDSISQLENLSILDLRGNPIDPFEIEKLRTLMPGCDIRF